MMEDDHHHHNNKYTQDELDTFLSSIESKLRSPFSSLDLARAAALTTATSSASNSSGSSSSSSTTAAVSEYLSKLLQVITKPDKIIQCRMVIGLLGIIDSSSTNGPSPNNSASVPNIMFSSGDTRQHQQQQEQRRRSDEIATLIYRILEKTQSEKDGTTTTADESGDTGELTASNKEWVRIISGLVQGILFKKSTTSVNSRNDDGGSTSNDDGTGNEGSSNPRESCRGKEAAAVVSKLGSNVCQLIEKEIKSELQHYPHHYHENGSIRRNDDDDTTTRSQSNGSTTSTSSSQISRNIPPDLNACFAPYRYSLVSTSILNTIIPEFDTDTPSKPSSLSDKLFGNNCHFQVDASAEILREDEELEHQRAKEQLEHQTASSHSGTTMGSAAAVAASVVNVDGSSGPSSSKSAAAAATAIPANFRPANLTSSRKGTANAAGTTKSSSSSLFMPNSKGRMGQAATAKSNLFNTSASRPAGAAAVTGVQKILLRRKLGAQQHVNRTTAPGAVGASDEKQDDNNNNGSSIAPPSRGVVPAATGGIGMTSLVGKGSRLAGLVGNRPGAAVGRQGIAGRALKQSAVAGATKSKMKMIDISEVDDLTKRDNESNNSSSRASKKRRIMEQAQRQGIKKTKTPSSSDTATPAAPVAVTAAEGAPQKSMDKAASAEDTVGLSSSAAATAVGAVAAGGSCPVSDDVTSGLASILQDRNNKLTDNDQIRLREFMQGKPNPSPDQGPSYKMKIHEVRRIDDATGGDIKETFYIELDYNTYKFNQSKKVKRY